ncbi:tetratricopeptide repeat protein [Thermosulfuriphilus sp.]
MKEPVLSLYAPLPSLGKVLFPGRFEAFVQTVGRELSRKGGRVSSHKGFFYVLSPGLKEAVLLADELFSSIIDFFKGPLSVAPPPFQVVLELGKDAAGLTRRLFSNTDRLRPGHLYLAPQAAHQYRREKTASWGILTQLEPLEGTDLSELRLASSFKSEALFGARDLPFLGRESECFYCGAFDHHPGDCPSKKLDLSQQGLRALARIKPEHVGHRFEKAWFKKDLRDVGYLAFYDLRLIYQLRFLTQLCGTEAERWEGINLRRPTPPKGPLFLALDALRVGGHEEAQRLLDKLIEDRPQDSKPFLVLAFLAIESLNLDRALVFLEEALDRARLPVERSYLYLLKARCLDLKGQSSLADEALKDAFRIDKSCDEALYAEAIALSRMGVYDEAEARVRALIGQSSFFWMKAYLEPNFIGWQLNLEEILARHLTVAQEEALAHLTRAEEVVAGLKKVFSSEDEEVKTKEESLEEIRKAIYEGGIASVEEARKAAAHLALDGQGMIVRRQREVVEGVRELIRRYDDLVIFWREYPYKAKYAHFGRALEEIKEALRGLEILSKSDPQRNIKKVMTEAKRLEEALDSLEAQKGGLISYQTTMERFRYFLRLSIIGELLVLLITLGLPTLFSYLYYLAPQIFPFRPRLFFDIQGKFFIWATVLVLIYSLVKTFSRED